MCQEIGKFLYSAFNNYTNEDIINFLEENDVPTKQERGNRVFPESDKAKSVLTVFEKIIKRLNIEVLFNCPVNSILVEDNKVLGVSFEDNKLLADKVILATGGMSYPITGSTGDRI